MTSKSCELVRSTVFELFPSRRNGDRCSGNLSDNPILTGSDRRLASASTIQAHKYLATGSFVAISDEFRTHLQVLISALFDPSTRAVALRIVFAFRRPSSSCLITLDKQSHQARSRSASFSEDLSARLQILAAGTSYRSYASTTVPPPTHINRPSSSVATTRILTVSNISSK